MSANQQREIVLYTLDPNKLLKAVQNDQTKFVIVRWCLDYLFSVKKGHIASIKEIKKAWPFNDALITNDALRIAPEYLTVLAGTMNGEDDSIHSRILKQHFEQLRIMKLLGEGLDVEDLSLANKREMKSFGQEIEVFKDIEGKALGPYKGVFPTRSYDATREAFCLSGGFYNHLASKYPEKDIDKALEDAHSYLVKTPLSRRHHASMKRYLEAWISGDLLLLNKMKKKKPQINKKDFYESMRNE